MGMLMHHTWVKQQEEQKKQKKTAESVHAEPKEEPASEPKKTGGRRKVTK